MRFNKKDYTNLESVFIKAYREKEKPQASEQWEINVMRHIRSIGALSPKISYWELFEQFGWRFASAACVLIVLLMICIVKVDFVPEDEMVKFSIEHPIESGYIEIPGL